MATNREHRSRAPLVDGDPEKAGGLFLLSVTCIIGGASIGLVGALFRFGLVLAEAWRGDLVAWAHRWPLAGWIFPVALAAAGAGLARWLVRFAPVASGSGVQHVEAVMRGEAQPAPLRVVPIKFLGGLLAIGSGLALGREGPTVQMGSTIGEAIAAWFRMGVREMRHVQSALAGAGLAVAFNAPLGGAIFVFEEVSRSFNARLTLATLLGTATAIAVSRQMLGDHPEFLIGAILPESAGTVFLHVALGVFCGALGVAYNRATIAGLDLFGRVRSVAPEIKAAAIGCLVGLLAWFAPNLVGGGELLNLSILDGGLPVGLLAMIFFVRLILGPLSYSAGTPGGIFAPLLVVGSSAGALFGAGFDRWMPGFAPQPEAFAIVGMAAFFTAVVRAPLTGIALTIEMTANTSLLVPLFAACFAASATAGLLGGQPIYDTLRLRMLGASPAISTARGGRRHGARQP